MEIVNRRKRRLCIAALVLSGMLVMCVGFPNGKIVCEAKGEEQEVIDFVTSYYKVTKRNRRRGLKHWRIMWMIRRAEVFG